MAHLISPSLLSADFGNLQRDIEMINKSDADWIHLDIMDGLFVPNISYGFPIIQLVKKHAKKPIDAHLMIVDPDRYIDDFYKAGANILTVHYEACNHLHRTIQKIKSLGMKAGVSLNPHSPVHLLSDIIADVDLVLIMSVNPGYGGQKFIPNAIERIKELKKLISDKKSKAQIEIDGGVDNTNAKILVDSGCDVLVSGSYIFKSENQIETIKGLKNLKF
ncbi:MAG: ribulose-phosphate 3-epimerase [Bacteroidales bacterium]|jgi:ribulose-phosphate 3-epimerase|nr:ribulose-phosphate 3-epimerase [Bacteroidales bacterium]